MKIKLDQNLSIHLRKVLAALNHDVDTVFDEGLTGVDDESVLKAASLQDRILFTLDTDFLNLKAYPPASHSGIVVFRPPRQGALTLGRFVKAFVLSNDLRRHRRLTTIVERTRIRVFK
jgi:predicted nuclease of predicted toxin-antitoxin system